MGYNPFRWYTSGKYRKRPLKSNAPLLLKIQNGDFGGTKNKLIWDKLPQRLLFH